MRLIFENFFKVGGLPPPAPRLIRLCIIMALENHLLKTTLNSDLDLDLAGEEGYVTVSKKHEVIPLPKSCQMVD